MDRDTLVYVCSAPWNDIRARIDAMATRGDLDSLIDGALLLAEAEIRGKVPATDDLPERVWSLLRTARHPLGWLSSRKLPVEGLLSTWHFGPHGGGSVGLGYDGNGKPLPDGSADPTISEERNAPESLEAFNALSNGMALSISFEFASQQALTTGLLAPLKSRFEPVSENPRAVRVSPAAAVAQLLATAINGGAYNTGNGAAFGRLEGWRTVRWLSGLGRGSAMATVAAQAERCSWLWLATSSDWFYDVAWDGCCACLSADGRRLAAVAWTDTD